MGMTYTLTDDRMKTLDNNFIYHAPKGDQAERYQRLRELGKALAEEACRLTPPSREQAVGLTELETALFWFNAAIARNE